MKPSIDNIVFWVCLGVSVIMFVAGFILPPTGVIDNSVLKAGGILLGFGTLAVAHRAVKDGLDAKFSHGNTTVELTHADEDN